MRDIPMYLLEPIVNRIYRRKMAAFLRMDELARQHEPIRPDPTAGPCLLYVHVPFCESLCPYCSFHRCEFEETLATRYFAALWREFTLYRDLGFDFDAIYVGGGTPTVMMDKLAETLDRARKLFRIRDVSVETNPNHLTPDHLSRLKESGVNRLSVGVQSFNDDILHHIGRLVKYGHAADIKERLAGAAGQFDTLNIDLIFNIPIQTDAILQADLDAIDALRPDQVTFYPLMTAPSVESVLRHSLGPIDYAQEKRQYFAILERMRRHYAASTAWCFSRKDTMIDEYIIDYDNYVGMGSGAFGFYEGTLHINTFSIPEYLAKLDRHEFPVTRVKHFRPAEQQYYFLLRKLFGLTLPRDQFRAGLGLDGACHIRPALALLRAARAFVEGKEVVRLTERGMYYWVMAMREFFIAVDTLRDQCRRPSIPPACIPTSPVPNPTA